MKERIQFVIAAILLSAGVVSVPYSAGSGIALNAGEVKPAVGQCALGTPFKHYRQVDNTGRFHRVAGITSDKGKCVSLLWHRFSLTPHPEFTRWVAKMWNDHTTLMLLVI